MSRLPTPGQDAGNWGNILNDFLSTSLDTSGNLKAGIVGTSTLADGAVTLAKLAISSAPTAGQTLSYDGTQLSWVTPSGSGSVPDATASVKGLVQLTGDLGGTAAAPTVPGLTAKADASSVVALTGTQTITGLKNFTGGLQSGGSAVVTTSDARLSDTRTPTDGTVTTVKIVDANVTSAKIADNSITKTKLSASNSPSTGQILSYNGTNFTWVAAAASDPAVGGDLSGTASTAQIVAGAVGPTELATNAVTTVKIADANVTSAKIADGSIVVSKLSASNAPAVNQVPAYNGTNFTWVAQGGGGGDPVVGGDLSGTASNAQIIVGAVGSSELATNAVITAKIADNAITEPKLAASNVPATNQLLSWDGTNLTWVAPPSGSGGNVWNAVAKSGAYTASSGDFVICDTTSSGFTVTLPAPANGAYVTVKKKTNNVNAVLVAPPSGVIDAGSSTSSTISVNNYGQVADFLADGTGWHQVG